MPVFPRETKARASRRARLPRLSPPQGLKAAPSSRAGDSRGNPGPGGCARAFGTKTQATRNRFGLTSISRKGFAEFSNKLTADRAFMSEVSDRVERAARVGHCRAAFSRVERSRSIRSTRFNFEQFNFPCLSIVCSSGSAEPFRASTDGWRAFVSREAGVRDGRDDATPGQGLATRRWRRAMPQASDSAATPRRQSRSRDVVAPVSRGEKPQHKEVA